MSRLHARTGERALLIANGALLTALCALMLYPFWFIICQSLSDPVLVRGGGMYFWPRGFSLSAYEIVFTNRAISYAFGNTVYVTLSGTILSLIATMLMAYPLARSDMPLRGLAMRFVIFPFLFTGGMIPTYLIVKQCGLLDSHAALVLPSLISSYNVIIMRSFIMRMPMELQESAYIDGASDFRVFAQIVVPLSLPVIATIGLWLAVGYWNNYFNALIYLSSKNKRVMQQLLREIIDSTNMDDVLTMENPAAITPETVKAAAIFVSALPILCVYPFLQKYFVKGVMLGAVKG